MSTPWWRERAGVASALASVVLVGVLAWPMLFTKSSFGGDWLHHLWIIRHQSLDIRANDDPSFFLNSAYAVYYPLYAFYGGTIYAIAGALALVPGSSLDTAYVASYVVGLGAAYGGWYWISRMAQLDRWLAHAPGLAFVTSASYVTLIYGRGDWPEFVGVSMIPLLIAAGASILRADRLRAGPALALAGSGVIFFGSHGLTIIWGSTIIAITALIVIACAPASRSSIGRAGVRRLAVVIIPALLVSAWYILPILAYSSRTKIGDSYGRAQEILHETMGLVSWDQLFSLHRTPAVPEAPGFILALPVLVIAWALLSVAILAYPSRGKSWMRVLWVFAAMTTAITVLMTHLGLLLDLPKPYSLLQFSYRLENYVLLGIGGAVLAILALAQGSPGRLRLWRWTIVPVLLVSVIAAIRQVDAYPRAISRSYVTLGVVEEAFSQRYRDYDDVSLPVVASDSLPKLNFPVRSIHNDRISVSVRQPPGQRVVTNIDTGPYLVHVQGASVVGRSSSGFLVLAVAPHAPGADAGQAASAATSETISLSPATGWPIVLGRLLTLVGILALAAGFVALLLRRRSRAATRS